MRICMRRVFRADIAAGLVVMALVSVAPADAAPPVPLPNPGPVMLDGYCTGFTARVTYTEFKQKIVQQTTAPDGTQTLKITGNARATVTNLSTGKAVSYNISGPGTLVIYPDGAFSVDAHGPNLFWTLPQNSFPDVPTISYTTGHVTFAVNASSLTTSYDLSGRQTDVCTVLAS